MRGEGARAGVIPTAQGVAVTAWPPAGSVLLETQGTHPCANGGGSVPTAHVPGSFVLRFGRCGACRAPALASTGDSQADTARCLGLAGRDAFPSALRLGNAGATTPVDARKVAAVLLLFTTIPVVDATGPARGAAPSVAKRSIALAISGARALGHVVGPGVRRTSIERRFVEIRERAPCALLINLGGRRAHHLRRRGNGRRGRPDGLRHRPLHVWSQHTAGIDEI